jgi:hypothetical protein
MPLRWKPRIHLRLKLYREPTDEARYFSGNRERRHVIDRGRADPSKIPLVRCIPPMMAWMRSTPVSRFAIFGRVRGPSE